MFNHSVQLYSKTMNFLHSNWRTGIYNDALPNC